MRKNFFIISAILLMLVSGVVPAFGALNANSTYTIVIQKVNSNGTVSDYSTTTGTTDSNGKLTFTLTNLPTINEANFLVFIIKDSSGNVVRKGFVPAPPPGSTNLVGVNNMSTVQTNAVLAAAEAIGTDDPIAVAYLLAMMRSPEFGENDALLMASVGKDAIVGSGGFEDFLLQNGVTRTQLDTFKSRLIYNPTSGKKTIADFTASFKAAVDSGDATFAMQEMQKAGGFMADVFMDAAEAAGIDFTLIMAAHDAAGVVAQNDTNQARMLQLSSTVRRSVEQAMSSFFRRIAAVKVKSEYSKALSTLNASGDQLNNYLTAVQEMMNAQAQIDAMYGEYFQNPEAYIAAQGTDHAAVRAAIDQIFQQSFATFQNSITSTDAEINQMKTNVANSFSIGVDDLPYDFGKYYDFTGQQKNWPIPQVVMVNWLASIIGAGGSFSYTRDTLPIPNQMSSWLGTCTSTNILDEQTCTSQGGQWNGSSCTFSSMVQSSCLQNNGNWTPQRRSYNTPSAAFNAYLGLQEDIQIIEFSRSEIYQNGQPTREQEMEARKLFYQRMEAAVERISGTVDGTTPISTEQKKAVIKLMMQPSMF